MGIGRSGTTDARKDKKVTSTGIDADPLSAVRIARFHTWRGLQYQTPNPAAAPAAVGRAPVKQVKRKLVAGKDYPVVEITDGMSKPEIRQARIANAKAKSAAYKALKEAGQDMVAAPVAATAAPAAVGTAPAAPALNLPPEPEYIEITDDMPPDEVRKARIANSKAKSAYNKALKAMGIDPQAVNAAEMAAQAVQAAAAATAAATAAPAEAAAPGSAVDAPPPPDMVEITDDMPPDEIRQARIANAKAKSAYKKQLKAMGIDPTTVEV
jgi:Fe2+ transport system protein FeoA